MDFLNLIIALEIGIMDNKKKFRGIMLEKKRFTFYPLYKLYYKTIVR